jgi:hypothetical protein
MLIWKEIKPAKFDPDKFMDEVGIEALSIADDMLLDLELAVATWDHKVKFEEEVNVTTSLVEILVGTDDEIFRYVDEGTKPHPIMPKKPGGKLRFQSGYKAKSTPGVQVSSVGGPFGDVVYAKGVQHPGTKARNFTGQLTLRWRIQVYRRLNLAIQRAVKQSGHVL